MSTRGGLQVLVDSQTTRRRRTSGAMDFDGVQDSF